MNKTLALTLLMTSFLAIQAPASQQNKTVKTPQENPDSRESMRSLLRQKDKKGLQRKVAKPEKTAPQRDTPASRKDTTKPDYIDYPLLRQKDEKTPGQKNR